MQELQKPIATEVASPKVAVVVQTFPKLSETFIRRQVAFLDAAVICECFDKALYDQLGLEHPCYVIKKNSVVITRC